MPNQKKPEKARPKKGCEDCPKKERGKKKKASEFVEKVLEKMEAKLGEDQIKPSVGDYLRLLQYREEMEADEPKEIKVTWVEPAAEESGTEG
jgi:hypothetical protein